MDSKSLIKKLENQEFATRLADVYFDDAAQIDYQTKRYEDAVKKYEETFGAGEVEIYSAPGRTEVGGNHTDHQNGMVLAASINLDAVAVAVKNQENVVRILSEGYDILTVDLSDL